MLRRFRSTSQQILTPSAFQDIFKTSKRTPGHPQERPRRPKSPPERQQECPKHSQEASRRAPTSKKNCFSYILSMFLRSEGCGQHRGKSCHTLLPKTHPRRPEELPRHPQEQPTPTQETSRCLRDPSETAQDLHKSPPGTPQHSEKNCGFHWFSDAFEF